MMTWQMEQWGIIICIIWPIGFYLMLGLIQHIDNKRLPTCNWHCDEDNPYYCQDCGFSYEDTEDFCPYH